jgi:cell division protein FtsX
MGPIEGIVMTVLGFFFSWLLWSIVFGGIMSAIKALTEYDCFRKGIGRKESWILLAVYVGGFALFIKLLDS